MAGPSSPNGVATTSFDAPGRHRARPSFGSPTRICTARHTRTTAICACQAGRAYDQLKSQLSATAPKRAEAVSRIVSKTLRRLTGDRRFESISLQRGFKCEPDRGKTYQARPWGIAGVVEREGVLLSGDRGFESCSLQQRVSLSAASAFEVENPGLPRGCGRLAWRRGRQRRAGLSNSRQPAAISLSGHIPVPQCR
jgi:hypothetical protein